MTDYSSPHNLPIIAPATDLIRSTTSASALADAINALAVATGNAISIEGAAARWDKGQFQSGASLATLRTPGTYRAENSTIAASIADKPAGVTQPFDVEVTQLSAGSGVYRQTLTEWGANGPIQYERVSLSNTFPAWGRPGWDRGTLATGATLATLTRPGKYRADTSAIARSILDKPDGVVQPFTIEVTQLASGSGVYLQELTEWSASGPITRKRVSLSNTFPAWAEEGQANRTRLTAFGDSLTAGGDVSGAWPAGASWPGRIAQYLPGVTVTNHGRSGDTSDEILLRAGALPLLLTPSGGSIPASGSVAVTTSNKLAIRDDRTFSGSLAGVIGTLTHTTGGALTFTRTTSGTAVPVSGKAKFITSIAGAASDTLAYWAGRNDWGRTDTGNEPTMPEHVVANAQRFMEWAKHQEKRVLIVGPTTGRLESPTWQNFKDISEARRRLRELFPANFVDAQEYLVNKALADMGATPTAEDIAARQDGMIPPSLFAAGDDIHLSQATHAALAQYLFAPALLGRGWV